MEHIRAEHAISRKGRQDQPHFQNTTRPTGADLTISYEDMKPKLNIRLYLVEAPKQNSLEADVI